MLKRDLVVFFANFLHFPLVFRDKLEDLISILNLKLQYLQDFYGAGMVLKKHECIDLGCVCQALPSRL